VETAASPTAAVETSTTTAAALRKGAALRTGESNQNYYRE
jgi:hypothetical protein